MRLGLALLAAMLAFSAPALADGMLEAKLRGIIADLQAGTPKYEQMAPRLSRAYRAQEAAARTQLMSLGALQTLTYRGAEDGSETYEAIFENGKSYWVIGVAEDGKIDQLIFR